ncbi:adenylyl-sulfate kinase, partial [Alphaproteobacteria bacterium]|nr:adenylyl-sulfate kinase [Alphaproteobacteria bacterium]
MNFNCKNNAVFWITGLSGVGKTRLGNLLRDELFKINPNVIFIDGDEIRDCIFKEIGYSKKERLKVSFSYSNLCKLFYKQNLNVICSTISLFHEVQEWNRTNISNYIEIFLDSDIKDLVVNDKKNIYKNKKGEIVGQGISAQYPLNPEFKFNVT